MTKEFKARQGLIAPTIKLDASSSSLSPINIPHGTDPSSPVDGDIWTKTTGVYARLNGETKQLHVSSGDEVTKAYVDANDFLNNYPKAGLNHGENEIPIYSDYKFGLGLWDSSTFSLIDNESIHVVYYHATTPIGKSNVFRAYRISLTDTAYIFDNEPISLNGLNSTEYVKWMMNAGTNFVLLAIASTTAPWSTTKVVLVETNGSSKWKDWTLKYDVTALAAGSYNFSIVRTDSGDRILRIVYDGETTILTVYNSSLTALRTQTLYTKTTDVDFTDNSGDNRTGASITFGYNPFGIAFPFTWSPFTEVLRQKNSGYYQQTLSNGAIQGVGYSLTIAWDIPKGWIESGTGSAPSNLIGVKTGTYRYNAYSDTTWNTETGGMSTSYGGAALAASLVTDEYSGDLHVAVHGTWSNYIAGDITILGSSVEYITITESSAVSENTKHGSSVPIPDGSPWAKSIDPSALIAIGNQISFIGSSNKYGSKEIYANFSTTAFSSVTYANDTLKINNSNAIIDTSSLYPTEMSIRNAGTFSTTVVSGTPYYNWIHPSSLVHRAAASGVSRTWTATTITAPSIPTTIGSVSSVVFANYMSMGGTDANPVFWALVKSNNTSYYIAKYQSGSWTIPGAAIMSSEIVAGNTARGDSAYSASTGISATLLTESGKFIFFFDVNHVGGTVHYVSIYDTVTNTNTVDQWSKFSSKTGGTANPSYANGNGYGGMSAGYNSYFGYFVASSSSNYTSAYIVSSRDVRGAGAEISEATWLSTPSSRYEVWMTTETSVGLVANVFSYPLFLGGYYLTLPDTSLPLTANATNYIYITKTDTDSKSVAIEARTDYIPSSFKRILSAEIVTNAENVVSSKRYAFAGNGLPNQTPNAGKFLSTDGKYAYWAEVDALPSQTGNENKILSTDGTSAIWKYIPVVTQLSGVDNTYANALLVSGPTRTDDALGDTWIFADSKGSDTGKYGIKHNQASNYIEFWGSNAVTSYIDLTNGKIQLKSSTTGGLEFSSDPGPGSGDTAAIRYYAETGENTVLEISVQNDADDNIYLNATGGTKVSTSLEVTGAITASGDITAFSDERLKTNIATIANPLEIVNQLRGVHYDRKDTGQTSSGVIAQEVQPYMPMLVKQGKDGMLSVNHDGFSGLFIESIKELSRQIEELKEEIKRLKGE